MVKRSAGSFSTRLQVFPNPSWVTVFVLLLGLILLPSNQVRAQRAVATSSLGAESVKLGSTLVSFPVSALARTGAAVPNLSRENFEVYDEGVKQQIEFFSAADAPVSVGLVVDLSSSMRGRSVRVQQALQELTNYQREGDEYFIIAFNQEPWLQADFTSDFQEAANSVSLREPKGATALFDAMYLALEKIRHASHTRRAVIVLSDGLDNHSRYRFGDVRRLAEESDATVFTVALSGVWGRDDVLEISGRRVLSHLASSTGGGFYTPNSIDDLDQVFSQIGAEMRTQYQVAFVPSEGQIDGRWHRLKVRLINLPKETEKIVVRAKAGYWAK